MRKLAFGFTLLAFAIFAPLAIQAQTKGSLSGTVTDPAGAVVPGASVTLRNNATGASRTMTTADNGVFNFTNLDPGMYTVTVENAGFKKAVANNIEVNINTPAQVTIALEAGQVSETVTVTGVQDVVNTSSPTLTNVINTRQVTDLPLPTRNPLDLAALQAGIAVTGSDTRNASVGGLRNSSTNVTQDGINAMDNFVKTSSFFALSSPSLNSVSEFSITTNTVGSEQGRGVGQVNMVTKSGSNDFHGGVFYLIRNEALNATPFFNNIAGTKSNGDKVSPKPLLRQNFFGGDIGGPVYFPNLGDGGRGIFNGKDTAFFFFSYEGFRENFAVTRNRAVMTPEARSGMFRYARTCPTATPDPNCVNGVQTVNLLTVGNQHALNPIMTGIQSRIPLPNNTTCSAFDTFNFSCFQFNATGSDPSDKWVGRYDHQLVKHSSYGSHKLEVVMNRAHFFLGPDTFNNNDAPFPGGDFAIQESKRWLVTGALVSNFGSNITNVFRYGKQWAPVGFIREGQPTSPFVVMQTVADYNFTFMSQGRDTTVDQYIDNASWVKGKHLIRFGGDYQKVYADSFNDTGINESITLGTPNTNASGLSGGATGNIPDASTTILNRANAVYANVVGNLSSAAQTFNITTPTSGFVSGATRRRLLKEQDIAFYGQDQWRMWSNLTVNAGLRWEFLGVPTVPDGVAIQLTNPFDIFGISGKGNLFNPTAPTGAPPAVGTLDFVSGKTGIPLYNNDWNNFAPFIGIAWSPDFKKGIGHMLFGSAGHSSIRMGYSISYLRDGFTVISNALGTGTTNPGLIQTAANNVPTGVLTAGGVPLTVAPFRIPVTDKANFDANFNNSVWAVDPNLKVPYVQQWNIGYEREIFPNTALEVRYVGNHAVKVWRANNFNEVNIYENGFLNEFLRAQNNQRVCLANASACTTAQGTAGIATASRTTSSFGNWGLTGQVPLTMLNTFFGSPTSLNFNNSTFTTAVSGNNVGTFASTLAFNSAFAATRQLFAQNFFVANPNANGATLLTNDSMSNYNALEVELRRRFSAGLQFQADYTFSKAMGDAPANLGNSQADLQSFRTLRDKSLDYTRSGQDQTHRFVANALYELPFGKGRNWFSDANGVVNHIIGGWNVGTIITWATRPPWYVVSNRTTVNSFNAGSAPAQLNGITFDEFKSHVGIFRDPTGVYFIDPAWVRANFTPQCLAANTCPLGTPGAGQFGNFPINSLNGPQYFNIDMSLTKRWQVTEKVRLELKTTFINILNHPSFVFGNQTFDSTTLGKITSASGSERQIHFTGSVRF
jgi:Cna protein B-type domain.